MGKKQLELHMLRKFLSHESHRLRIKSIDESETPDFIIHEINNTISIELTRLMVPALVQKEKFQEKLVRLAWAKFRQKYPDKLQVLINFSNAVIKCSASEIDAYADEIARLIESIFLPNRGFEFRVSSIGRDKPSLSYIHSLAVANDLNLDDWHPFGAFRVSNIDIQWLKTIIQEKENRLSFYKTSFDQNWLLLLANFGHKSSTYEFDYLKLTDYHSKFDRIYLYKYIDDAYTRLL